ncbi:uncharacterized protein CDV56_101372 [Aspergillus thermomutatus]|uniref:C2H2-type domain-containing protein n=1 Tax=Aspergillus thermomutatus TaxID=41047 RepID=A0A397G5T6_ASPTH|nr:uncharacterized protein CDV56_101372 [Aspergillus thermomutatus]RHZ44958.1 hypothetical protein CDV56_101372 [Aspergillus thermomutatus]
MDNRPASEYAQSGSHFPYPPSAAANSEHPAADQASAAATAQYTPQQEVRPTPQYTPQPEVRPASAAAAANISSSNTPQSDYGLNQPPAARSPAYPDYLARPPQYHHAPNTQAGGAAGMAQATSPSMTTLHDGHQNDHRNHSNVKSDADVPIDPSIAASSPTYPPPYSPYQPQGHDMAQYQGHPPPPPPQMYGRPEWSHGYGQHQHGLPGPYSAPATTVGPASPAATAGPRPGQVYSFVPIPGAQQHKRPRRRYEEIERMYKCGWNGCEKAYGTLNHLNAHVTMQSHGAKRTPEEFKEIRKEWKARKKEEEAQRKAAEERERAAAAQAAQANQVDAPGPTDPAQAQPPAYASGVRPQLPPIGYQPADGQVPGQYGGAGGIVYQGNGQMAYPPNYPHSPYGQSGQVYQQPSTFGVSTVAHPATWVERLGFTKGFWGISNAAALRTGVQHTVGLKGLPASRWTQASRSIPYAAPLARATQRGRVARQPGASVSISGMKWYSTEASGLAAALEQSAADSTTSFVDGVPQQKQSRSLKKVDQDNSLLEIAMAGTSPDHGIGAGNVSKKKVKMELKWLMDPKALADRVAKILKADNVALAVALVRTAQKENMECSVAWNHLLQYCMEKNQPKAAWKLYNEMKKRGRKPTSWTYTIMLYGLATVKRETRLGLNPVKTALSIYRSIYDSNSAVNPSIIHSNAMLTVCCRQGHMDTLWEVASELPEEGPDSPDALTYTVILRAITNALKSDVGEMSEIDRILERRAKAVKEGKRIWSDVVYRWSKGQIDLDSQLVRTMAHLLLQSGSDRDCYDVFALMNQTTGIPILAKKPPPEGQRKPEMVRRQESRSAENKELEDVPFVDEGNRPYRLAETEMEEPEEKEEEEEDENEDFENLFDPVVSTDSASTMKKGTIGPSYVVPGNKELTRIIEACSTMTQGLGVGKAYWQHLTLEDHEYTIKPDMVSFHAYLRLLRMARASRVAVEVMRDQMAEPIGKTFHIALSSCRRDRRNINVFKNANELLALMDKSLVLPHARALESYLDLVQVLHDNPQHLVSLNGLNLQRKSSDSLGTMGRRLQLSLQTVALEHLRPHIDKLHEAMKNGRVSYITGQDRPGQPGDETVSGPPAHRVMVRTRGLIDAILNPENASLLSKSDRDRFKQESRKLREYSDVDMVKMFANARVHPTLAQVMAFQEKHDPKQNLGEAD